MGKLTVPEIIKMKSRGEKIAMLTAYDTPIARLLDEAGVEIILVGDSVGPVIAGYPNTLPVTVEEMIYHTKAVVRGVKRALVVIDMPFMSYQVSVEEARKNAGRMIKESGAEAVKLEGGANMKEVIKAITEIDIPVMGHIGLTPQSIHRMGGYKIQRQREKLLEDAHAVEEAGAFSVVLECVPEEIAEEITQRLSIPTIGIGAGIHCDGQVLVVHDLLGLLGDFRPKFVKRYVELGPLIVKAAKDFVREVKEGAFPTPEHVFHLEE
ncbi:MAG: 3-methyl-2-oxobutanoate hydroxymethyltransferase [Deltaproteobacteria bacterium]|nr:MAG: 3-methyl-2-oxobutanoate hydroxymethyltransferase [Deltaproteobacteria bacterium]RLA98135.1 MAG: 3-methyl-2-oxobutanoate hydroxymethyltransferase [Deltaproteobacteria bacterium]